MKLKLILHLMIIISSGMCGMLSALKYSDRCRILTDIITALEMFRIEIEYRRDSIPLICKRMANEQNKASGFFNNIASLYELGTQSSIGECWKRAAVNTYSQSALKTADIHIISEIGTELGGSGVSGQNRIIELYLIKLRKQLEESENERNSKGKMCISLGFAIGIAIVIIIS